MRSRWRIAQPTGDCGSNSGKDLASGLAARKPALMTAWQKLSAPWRSSLRTPNGPSGRARR